VEFTGERYIPELESPDISYEHWHRYLYAAAFVHGKVVLDVASGEGYGTSYLARTAKQVIGIEIDPEAIREANLRYRAPNLEFRQGSVEAIPVDGSHLVDVVVSFETIEHVSEAQQLGFVREVKRLLKPGGVFLVSTPDRLVYSDRPGYRNEFHRREFYQEEFLEFLRGFFGNVSLFGQHVYPVSYIWPLSGTTEKLHECQLDYADGRFSPSPVDRKEPLFLIAACTDGEAARLGSSILVDPADRRGSGPREQLSARDAVIEKLNLQLAECQTSVRLAIAEVSQREGTITDLNRAVAQQRARIDDLQREVERLQCQADAYARDRSTLQLVELARREFNERTDMVLAAVAAVLERVPAAQSDRERYCKLIGRVRAAIVAATEPGAVIAVVNKGDAALLDLPGRHGLNFPQDAAGAYAGFHPADGPAAVAAVRAARARGAGYLALPATARWWLEHYPELAAYLRTECPIVSWDDDACIVFALGASNSGRAPVSPDTRVTPAVARRGQGEQL
jgi:SAM-dependent methyltransferase/uncharacterized coiled-coil protein SlyX